MAQESEDVIKVPGAFKGEFVAACKDPDTFGVCIQSEDCDTWQACMADEALNLSAFCAGHFAGAPSKSWRGHTGVRYGYNKEGVFLQAAHCKRYFGIKRENASISLRLEVPEALPEFYAGDSVKEGTRSTDRLLCSMMTKLPTISSDMRHEVLRATFEKADVNGNGVLSRNEVGTMFRKVVMTMSAAEVEDIMRTADENMDKDISYQEFVKWLETSAPEKVQNRLVSALRSEADVVKASFRIWDRDGDGVISRRELEKVLTKMCKNFAPSQVKTICDLIDADSDGNVDYDEFVDFLFFKHK